MKACESEQQQLHGDGLHQEHCVRCGHENLKRRFVDMLESWVGAGHPHTAPTSVTQSLYHECEGSELLCNCDCNRVVIAPRPPTERPKPILEQSSDCFSVGVHRQTGTCFQLLLIVSRALSSNRSW